jgi:peroxiredoxin Q/BCP
MPIPEVGEKAPEFQLVDDRGQVRKLSEFLGNPLILYFYPKDDTPGCTKEACNFRDDYDLYLNAGVEILGVSPDTQESHAKFRDKFNLPFPLLADGEHRVSEAYGVWAPKQLFGREFLGVRRTTFVIDEEGKISHVFENVDAAGHSEELLQALEIDETSS